MPAKKTVLFRRATSIVVFIAVSTVAIYGLYNLYDRHTIIEQAQEKKTCSENMSRLDDALLKYLSFESNMDEVTTDLPVLKDYFPDESLYRDKCPSFGFYSIKHVDKGFAVHCTIHGFYPENR